MTIPVIVQHHKKSVASSRIKKFVSVVNQALIYAESDYGPREGWTIGEGNNSDSAYDFLNTYIKPYVKSFDIEKRTLFGMNMATLRFADGSQMSVKVGSCYDIYFDINGEKLPNEKGRDIYMFILCRENGRCSLSSNKLQAYFCQPSSGPKPTHEQFITGCHNGGIYCTKLLEENQYEFPKDYPKRL